jgi:5-histidylcysteine sulfoxide synthase/putative 4-mercaptohistidine N1-methyltranferase
MKRQRNPNLDIFLSLHESHSGISKPFQLIFGNHWWTGPSPHPNETVKSLPIPEIRDCSRESVLAYFNNTWMLTEVLFSSLKTEAAFFKAPYHGLRHPLIFYYAHPATFYINKFRVAGLIEKGIQPYFEQFFETGVDEMTWDDLSKNEMDWPSLEAIHRYRKAVYQIVSQVIQTHPDLGTNHPPLSMSHSLWALFMAFEHERIHLETSSVLIRELPLSELQLPPQWPSLAPHSACSTFPQNVFVPIPEGNVTLGKPDSISSFGWDNEYGKKQSSVPAFEVSRHLVSNGEFLNFVRDGGYQKNRFWSESGWHWCSNTHSLFPSFWVPKGPQGLHDYALRTLFDIIDLPLDWPVIVNFHEAKAYAQWKSEKDNSETPYRFLTEAEHHRLPTSQSILNINLTLGSESSVDLKSHHEVCHARGNVWQWSEDTFQPLPGFRVHPYYEDFSTPCFDGHHQMILGGSFMSTGDEATSWARFHFRPHFFQHAGFRLVRSKQELGVISPNYEGSQILNPYLLLHFGTPEETLSFPAVPKWAFGFPQNCAQTLIDWMKQKNEPMNRAIDIGCAVGGAVFHLAESFQEVWGVDLSATLIEAAKTLQSKGKLSYERVEEGEIRTPLMATVHSKMARERAHFRQADACSLPSEWVGFDAVLLANLLCRVPSPRAVLNRLGGERGILRKGGILVIATPFSWLEKFSQKEVWLGGYYQNGEPVFSENALKNLLGEEFTLLEQKEIPLMIREHARKFEFIIPLVTVWQKNR